MKKMINGLLGVALVAAMASMPLQGMQKKAARRVVESPAARVDKEITLLDRIVQQIDNVIRAENNTVRAEAKEYLKTLMANKDLDGKIKELIKDDIAIILKTTYKTIKASQDAFDHLLDVIASVDAQANVVTVTQQATEMVQNAPEGEKAGMMQLAYQKIQEATKAAQDMAGRAYVGAKSMVTRPVNYVFGEESSKAKTAFYATVGALALAGAYGVYQYSGGLASQPIKSSDEDFPSIRRMGETVKEPWVPSENSVLRDQIHDIRKKQGEIMFGPLSALKVKDNKIVAFKTSDEEFFRLDNLATELIKKLNEGGDSKSNWPIIIPKSVYE